VIRVRKSIDDWNCRPGNHLRKDVMFIDTRQDEINKTRQDSATTTCMHINISTAAITKTETERTLNETERTLNETEKTLNETERTINETERTINETETNKQIF